MNEKKPKPNRRPYKDGDYAKLAEAIMNSPPPHPLAEVERETNARAASPPPRPLAEVERDIRDTVLPSLHLHVAGGEGLETVCLCDMGEFDSYNGEGITYLHRCRCGAVRYLDKKHKVLTPWSHPDDANYRNYEAAYLPNTKAERKP